MDSTACLASLPKRLTYPLSSRYYSKYSSNTFHQNKMSEQDPLSEAMSMLNNLNPSESQEYDDFAIDSDDENLLNEDVDLLSDDNNFGFKAAAVNNGNNVGLVEEEEDGEVVDLDANIGQGDDGVIDLDSNLNNTPIMSEGTTNTKLQQRQRLQDGNKDGGFVHPLQMLYDDASAPSVVPAAGSFMNTPKSHAKSSVVTGSGGKHWYCGMSIFTL